MEEAEYQFAQPAISAVLMKSLVPLLSYFEWRDLERRIDDMQVRA